MESCARVGRYRVTLCYSSEVLTAVVPEVLGGDAPYCSGNPGEEIAVALQDPDCIEVELDFPVLDDAPIEIFLP